MESNVEKPQAFIECGGNQKSLDLDIQNDSKHYFTPGLPDIGASFLVDCPARKQIIVILASALALRSFWALIPGGLFMVLLVVRTALEDRTLQDEFEGYKEYAQKVRYRLVPFIW